MRTFPSFYAIYRSLIFGLLAALLHLPSAHAAKTNVILILSDNHGFTDNGFMGHQVVQTPNIGRMASESLLYTRGYVMPVCSPSLASLLTGKLPHAHGITGNDLSKQAVASEHVKGKADRSPLGRQLLGNSVILPKVLTAAGYLTYQNGKLWNVTAEEVGFTAGMTNKEGRHGGDGLDIGGKTMKPMFDFFKAYTHDIADLRHPENSLVTQVVIDGWSKLLIPGPVSPDKAYTSAAKKIELFHLKSDPLETKDLAAEKPDEVKRLTARQDAEWSLKN